MAKHLIKPDHMANLTGTNHHGDQITRRGSESSLSSGDSGTPIDFEEGAGEGHYYTTVSMVPVL